MRGISRKFGCVCLLLAGVRGNARAAGRDTELELVESTYRVNDDATVDFTFHERWKALTAEGRTAGSQIRLDYAAGYQDYEIRF